MPRSLSLAVVLSLAGVAVTACTPRPGSGPVAEESGACSLEWREPRAEEPAGVAPFSLTAQDGTGLELVSVKSRAVVEDPLAFTELHLVFRNPNDRVIEGRFEIDLPSGAAISRFAMMIDGRWQEAEVVELQAARQAYEDFLHRRQDPALLEKAAGNRFGARVFPIPARGTKEIIVSYSEELAQSGAPYRLHLRGLPQLQDLDVEVVVPKPGGPERVAVRKQAFMPQQDLELQIGRRPLEVGLRYDRLAVARVAPDIKLPQVPVRGVTLLFDTSASRALDFKGQVARLGRLVAELRAAAGDDFDLRVVAFDQSTEPVFVGKASGFSADAQQALLRRGPLGASDLTAALKWVAQAGGASERVIVVSDGVATAGETELGALREAASELGKVGVRRLDAVVDGGLRDDGVLRQLTTAGLEQAGVVVDAQLPAPLVASRLARATVADLKVHVPGATWVWPSELGAVQPGDQFLIYADLPEGQPMRIELGDARDEVHEIGLRTSQRPLLERAWVKASIDRLGAMLGEEAAGDAQGKAAIKQQIVELSTKYRVLSDYTALLVLETEWDYQRFGIDRRALAEILTVGQDGIAVVDRTNLPQKPDRPAIAVEETRRQRDDGSALDWFFGDGKDKKETGSSVREKNLVETRTAATNFEPPAEAAVDAPTLRADGWEGDRERGADPGAPGGAPGGIPQGSGSLGDSLGGSAAPVPPPPPDARMQPIAEPEPLLVQDEEDSGRFRDAPRRDAAPGKRKAGSVRPLAPNDPFDGDALAMRRPQPRPQPTTYTPPPAQPQNADAWDGRFAEVMTDVRAGKPVEALARAYAWREQNPGDELALIALGEAAEAVGDRALAARAYGSLIDLFPGRADLRRMAGERLEALGDVGLPLAVDTFAQAVEQRPDHPASHRLYAFALLKAKRPDEAFRAALAGARRTYPSGRFLGVPRILEDDLRLIAAAWLAQRPNDDKQIREELARAGVTPDTGTSLRFVLNWETDANDVDFHIYDGKGGHAYYSSKVLPSGGELYADVTTGYGPECFTITGTPQAFPYVLQAHYFSRGPMGYGMGKLEAIEHDGRGNLLFMEYPFVIMKDRAYVDLGRVDRPLAQQQGAGPRLPAGGGAAAKPFAPYTPPPPAPPPGVQVVPPSRY